MIPESPQALQMLRKDNEDSGQGHQLGGLTLLLGEFWRWDKLLLK